MVLLVLFVQAQREEYEKQQRAQQDEWEKSFKMLYPEATAAEKKKTTQGKALLFHPQYDDVSHARVHIRASLTKIP